MQTGLPDRLRAVLRGVVAPCYGGVANTVLQLHAMQSVPALDYQIVIP